MYIWFVDIKLKHSKSKTNGIKMQITNKQRQQKEKEFLKKAIIYYHFDLLICLYLFCWHVSFPQHLGILGLAYMFNSFSAKFIPVSTGTLSSDSYLNSVLCHNNQERSKQNPSPFIIRSRADAFVTFFQGEEGVRIGTRSSANRSRPVPYKSRAFQARQGPFMIRSGSVPVRMRS